MPTEMEALNNFPGNLGNKKYFCHKCKDESYLCNKTNVETKRFWPSTLAKYISGQVQIVTLF